MHVPKARPAVAGLVWVLFLGTHGAAAQGESTRARDESEAEDSGSALAPYLELLTVTATGREESIDRVPLPVSVIPREEIVNSQEESVADLLRRVPGVAVMRSGDEGGVTSVFIRGTESDQTLALFDGVRLNSPYFAGYDWSLQSSAGIERIEVARGPYSALWGADAIGGVINVLPGSGGDGLSGQLFGEVGEDVWRRIEANAGWGSDRFDLFASVFDREGRGELDNSDFSSRQLLFDAGFAFSQGGRVAVLYQDLDAAIGIPLSGAFVPSPERRQDSRQTLLAAPFRLQASGRWNLELTPSAVEREVIFRDPGDPGGFTGSDTVADTLQARFGSHHDLSGAAGKGNTLSWGAEWREDTVDAGSNFGTSLDGDETSVAGLFAQDQWQTTDRLTVIAGLRWDDAEEWGSELSPRLALGWQLTDSVELRAAYGRAFRQPSIGELYFPFSGNPTLEAEHSQSAELGVGWRLAGHRVDAFLFATDTDNLIDFDFTTQAFANVSEASIRGAEMVWAVPIARSLRSSLQGTWLDTEDVSGQPLLRRPEWSGSWTLTGFLTERWRGDLGLFFVGSRADVDPITFGRAELPSHLRADLGIAVRVIGGLEVTLRAQNLADESYQEVAGYPAPGRRFSGGLRWSI